MNRRSFLQTGVASYGVHTLRRRFPALHGEAATAKTSTVGDGLLAGLLWSARSVDVPLIVVPHGVSKFPVNSLSSRPADPCPEVTSDLHAVFRADFLFETAPEAALLHLFAFTRYRLYVNGVYAGRGPSRYQNQEPEYDTRDLSSLLHSGRNVIAVLVHRDAPCGRIMSHPPGFTAILERSDSSRTVREISPQDGWRAIPEKSFLPRRKAWSSIPENLDTRRSGDWSALDFDAAHWPRAVPVPKAAPANIPLRLVPRGTPLERETSVAFRTLPESQTDFVAPGQLTLRIDHIVQAYVVLDFDAAANSEVEVHFELPDGTTSGVNTLITRDGRQKYTSGDTYACNQIRVQVRQGSFRLHKAEVIEVLYPFDIVGEFHCDDPDLEQLWHICTRSTALLSEEAYVDCADRERVEWMDCSPPAYDVTQVALAGPPVRGKVQWGDPRLLRALLRRIALTQMPNGQVRAYTCSDRWDVHTVMEDRSCGFVVAARQYYERTKDRAFLHTLWPVIVRLCDWYLAHRTSRGLVLGREWEVWDNPLRYQICEGTGLNALAHRALRDAAFLGEALGFARESHRLRNAADALASQCNELLWSPASKSYTGALFGPGSVIDKVRGVRPETLVDGVSPPTLQAALFALYGGIVPPYRVEDVHRFVRAHIDEGTGTMSNFYLFEALYSMASRDADAEVLRLLRSRWKPQIESPWQTSWETLTLSTGSRVHIYGVLPAYFMSAYVLGVREEGDQLTVGPRCGDLSAAHGVVITQFGPVKISWKRPSVMLEIQISVPSRAMAELRLPDESGNARLHVDGVTVPTVRQGRFLTAPLKSGHHYIQITN